MDNDYVSQAQKLMRALEWAVACTNGLYGITSQREMPGTHSLLDTVISQLNWAIARVPDRYQKDTGRELPDSVETEMKRDA